MLELNAILDIVTLILLALGGYALVLLKAGTEAAVKTSAEEAAKATIQQLQWPAELARELQKTRGRRKTRAPLQELWSALERTSTACDLR